MLGKRLKNLREKRGWSQKDLAKRLGVTRAAVGNYETGARIPDVNIFQKMSDVFGVSIDYLTGTTEYTLPREDYFKDIDQGYDAYKSLVQGDPELIPALRRLHSDERFRKMITQTAKLPAEEISAIQNFAKINLLGK